MKESKGLNRRDFLKYAGVSMGAIGASGFLPGLNAFSATPKYGGHFRAALVGTSLLRSLDPALGAWSIEMQVGGAMFNSLLRYDENLNFAPDLAQSWTMPNDTTYRFKLFPGIKFHDGEDCTAEDIVYSLERVRDPKTGSPHKGKLDEVDQIKAIDKYTVEVITKKPFGPFLAYMCNARTGSQIVSRKAVEKYGADFGKKPVGTGPFKLVEWKPGEKLEFVKHDKYFTKGLPYVDKVTIPFIPEASTATNAIMSGDVDLLSTLLFSDVKSLENAKGIKVVKKPGTNVRFLFLNNQRKPFDDIYVRKAFAQSFDRKSLIDAVIYGEGVSIQGIIPPAIKWAYHPNLKGQSFNPEKAREFLKKAKYKESDLNFTILTWGTGWWKRLVEIVAAQSSEVLSIPVKVEVIEEGALVSRFQQGNYQASVFGWLGLVDPDEYAYENFHSKGSKNYFKYSNSKVDELLEKARTTLNRTERARYYHQAEEIIDEEAPGVFCFSNMEHNAMRDQVEGFNLLPFNGFGQGFDRVWLDK